MGRGQAAFRWPPPNRLLSRRQSLTQCRRRQADGLIGNGRDTRHAGKPVNATGKIVQVGRYARFAQRDRIGEALIVQRIVTSQNDRGRRNAGQGLRTDRRRQPVRLRIADILLPEEAHHIRVQKSALWRIAIRGGLEIPIYDRIEQDLAHGRVG
mgnify:CR=1 FL=1